MSSNHIHRRITEEMAMKWWKLFTVDHVSINAIAERFGVASQTVSKYLLIKERALAK